MSYLIDSIKSFDFVFGRTEDFDANSSELASVSCLLAWDSVGTSMLGMDILECECFIPTTSSGSSARLYGILELHSR